MCTCDFCFETCCCHRWRFFYARHPFKSSSPFPIWYASCDRRGFRNLMFPLWFALIGGSFVFLDVGPSILFLLFNPFSGCFLKFVIGRVSSTRKLLLSQVTSWTWARHSKALKSSPEKKNKAPMCAMTIPHFFILQVFYCCLKTGELQLIKELMILMRVRKHLN